jgi:hypothetical protein
VTARVKAKAAFVGEAPVTLSFPPELPQLGAVIREGFYARTLTRPTDKAAVPATILDGALENAPANFRVFVGVDGYDRAFIFQPSPKGGLEGDLNRYEEAGVRVYPAAKFAARTATAPVAAFPVRVEADNPPVGATLELRLRPARIPGPPPAGEAAKDELLRRSEVVKLGGARDEQVWLDPSGPGDGGLLVTRRSRDWVWPLDLRAVRGTHEVVAVLSEGGREVTVSAPLVVTVDDTPPENVVFGPFPAKLLKDQPLPVSAAATDRETGVVKATFFVGGQLDDGTFPAGAVTVAGVRSEKDATVWVADLPVPAGTRGDVVVGVVFTNQVGLATTRTARVRVQLILPPPPRGRVEGRVLLGDRPQPDSPVTLLGADGTAKATATTDPTGKFRFEQVPPGGYSVASTKPDPTTGFTGSAPVQVRAGETAKATVSLARSVR